MEQLEEIEEFPWKNPQIKKYSHLFKFLSDPKRIVLLKMFLQQKYIFVEFIKEELNVSRAAAFAYTKELCDLGLIHKEKNQDKFVYYTLNKTAVVSKNKIRFENLVIEF